MYLFALWNLFYISIVFRFDGFKFHPFLERISMKSNIPTKQNIFTKWNARGAVLKHWDEKYISIKFLF